MLLLNNSIGTALNSVENSAVPGGTAAGLFGVEDDRPRPVAPGFSNQF
jgi:hypothetical protein